MGILVVIAIISLCSWIIIPTTRKLIGAHRQELWLMAMLLIAIGIAIGWTMANQEYHAGSNMRIIGIPMPLICFHLEDGQWVDFPLPPYVAWPGFVANILVGITICLLPLRLWVSTAKSKP